MSKPTSDVQSRILVAAYSLFYERGFTRVSMDDIASSAQVTKRSVYNHFESKDALLAAALESELPHALHLIEQWGAQSANSLEQYLAALFDDLKRWSSMKHWYGSGYSRLTMELADLPGHPARKLASNHKTSVEQWLCNRIDTYSAANPESLARQLAILIEGAIALTLIHGGSAYYEAAHQAAAKLLDQPVTPSSRKPSPPAAGPRKASKKGSSSRMKRTNSPTLRKS